MTTAVICISQTVTAARIEYPDQRRYIVARMNDERDTEHGIESAMHGKAVVQELRTDWNVRRFAFREVKVAGDKLTRALTWLNLARGRQGVSCSRAVDRRFCR